MYELIVITGFIKAFKKNLTGEELRYSVEEKGDNKYITYAFDYESCKNAFDAMLKSNMIKELVRISIEDIIKVKYNTPKKGYSCDKLTVTKVGDSVELKFDLTILRGK